MPLALVTARGVQPIDLADAKLHAKVDTTVDDALVTSMIATAADECEAILQRSTLPQTWRLTLDAFSQQCVGQWWPMADSSQLGASPRVYANGGGIVLQRPTVTAITSIKYLRDTDGAQTTLDPGQYRLLNGNPYSARVVPAFGVTWPAVQAVPEAVQIDFVSGWASASVLPEGIKHWVRMRVKDLYDNRGAWLAGKKIEVNPFVDFMLDQYLAKSF